MHDGNDYTRPVWRLNAALCLLCCTIPAAASAGLQWHLQADELEIAGIVVTRLEIDAPAGQLRFDSIYRRGEQPVALGSGRFLCTDGPLHGCNGATLRWEPPDAEPLDFDLLFGDPAAVQLTGSGIEAAITHPEADLWRFSLAIAELDQLPDIVTDELGLSHLEGGLDFGGHLHQRDGTLDYAATLELTDVGFDTPDGSHAGAGLMLDLQLEGRDGSLKLNSEWRGGEVLLGPVWVPPPRQPLRLSAVASMIDRCRLRIVSASMEQNGELELRATGAFDRCADDPRPDLALELRHVALPALWALGLDSVLAGAGWGGLVPAGRLEGTLALVDGELEHTKLQLVGGALEDPRQRLGVNGLGLSLNWTSAGKSLDATLNWDGAALYGIPLGAAQIAVAGGNGQLGLREAVRIPLLGGAFRLERLQLRDWFSQGRSLSVAASIDRIDLARLTRTLGWTEFGGTLSGRIPGVDYADGRLQLDGGLEIRLFDGEASVRDLAIERPFGTAPALTADIEFQRLDLALLTGAFEIGSMTGRASGHLRELRLIDWQPARFDAWVQTLGPGRISQKAVNTISTVAGGGGAALSGTMLKMFDTFPYKRIGLGCRLERNVCEMRGLESTDDGGYLIIEGRPFPVLNVVGHRRRVDWPQLMSQLKALMGSS